MQTAMGLDIVEKVHAGARALQVAKRQHADVGRVLDGASAGATREGSLQRRPETALFDFPGMSPHMKDAPELLDMVHGTAGEFGQVVSPRPAPYPIRQPGEVAFPKGMPQENLARVGPELEGNGHAVGIEVQFRAEPDGGSAQLVAGSAQQGQMPFRKLAFGKTERLDLHSENLLEPVAALLEFPGCLIVAEPGKAAVGGRPMRKRPCRWLSWSLAHIYAGLVRLPMWPCPIWRSTSGCRASRDFAMLGGSARSSTVFLAGAAACGAARLLHRFSPTTARNVLICLTAIMLLEYWVVQKPLFPVDSGGAIPPVYTWLAHEPKGVLLELPICGLPGQACLEESTYMYYSTYHWDPLVNGGGGFFPSDWNQRIGPLQTFPSAAADGMIHTLGVQYVVVHPDFPRYRVANNFCTVTAPVHGLQS